MNETKETITITFGECAENHVGMQQLGHRAESGIQVSDLQDLRRVFEENGFKCQLVNLNAKLPIEIEVEQAAVLVVRDGVRAFGLDPDVMFEKLKSLQWDKTMFSAKHGGEVNKLARHNICISTTSQKADIKNKKGTVYSFDDLPDIKTMKEMLEDSFDHRFMLFAEGNRYYDVSKCGIGLHGDSERKVVVAARFGASMKLVYKWFHNSTCISNPTVLELGHGDVYFMSEKATGWDWKKHSQVTLRHAAGCKKYIGDI
jgi:hypothetical protein